MIITIRIAYVVEKEGIAPRKLALTFSKEAARNMRKKQIISNTKPLSIQK
jgi:superfamily I DNA/RNA helicase